MPTLLSFLAFSLIVLQQPYGAPGYVAGVEQSVTQFRMAAEVGNMGMLAHNDMAGATFSHIRLGDQIEVVFDDGQRQVFLVTEIQEYQAVDPYSPYSVFINLDTQAAISAETLFRTVYMGAYHLTLQTCIEKDGILNWGRLFVIAQLMTPRPTQNIE